MDVKIPKPTNFKLPRISLGGFRRVAVGLVSGLIGGFLAIWGVNYYAPLGTNRPQQLVLEESSAIIEVAENVGPSVVSVVTESTQVDAFGRRQRVQSGAGSGIVLSDDGLILTNKHVVADDTERITITTSDHKEYTKVEVLARDPLNDLAYLKVEGAKLTAAQLGDSDQAVVGQRVIAIGNALGEFSNTVTSGIISGIGRPVTAENGFNQTEVLEDLIQTDAAINPGNSGGPLVNIEGQVIGMNTAVAGGAENIGFAIPINQAKSGIASINKTGELKKPFLGVRFINLTPEIAKENRLSVNDGAWVQSESGSAVIAGSPAAKAGVKSGDIITAVEGVAINDTRSLSTVVGGFQVGDRVKLSIQRGADSLELEVTLANLPSSE